MSQSLHIQVIAFQPDIGETALQTMCGAGSSEVVVDDTTLHFALHTHEAGQAPLEGVDLKIVNGVILLVRFLDSVSLEQLRAVHHALPSHTVLPQAIGIVREAGESEYKMSCSSCGQKLWVRDSDAGRSGRCPHCRKIFILPMQSGVLKSYLMLTESTPVVQIIKGKAGTGRALVSAMLDRTKAVTEAMKSSTMRVQIPAEESGKG